MDEIMELARVRSLPVIEDCSQAFLARFQGRHVGTIGSIGCFSLQQGKHITTGEGGVVLTDDDALARRMTLFVNKAWGYGDPSPDHYFLALNARMNELTGAVAVAQLEKLESSVARRVELAERLTERLSGLPGIATPWSYPDAEPTYWKYCLRVDARIVPGGPTGLASRLWPLGLPSAPRYIQKPAFQCLVFREQRTFGQSRFPFTLARPEAVDYRSERFPGTTAALDGVLVLPWNERLTEDHVDDMAEAIARACEVSP
jgi:dTDP-4-amino-4,6-dideoxygalactose transaminase